MRTYLADIIPKIQRFSRQLDDIVLLTNQNWVSLDEISQTKRVYIFDKNGDLDIYKDGVEVDNGTWKFINQSLKLKLKSGGYLLNHGFFDENVIALKLDSTDTYAFLVNETKYDKELNTIEDIIEFLKKTYLGKETPDFTIDNHEMGSLNEEFTYQINRKIKDFNFIYGHHISHKIHYSDGLRGFFYNGSKSGKYFFWHFEYGKIYCASKDDVITKYHDYLLEINSNQRKQH